jgi:hypothetical protein
MKNRINFDEYIIKDTSESETNPIYYSVDNISSSSYKTPVSDSFLNLRKHMFYYSIIPNNSRLELLAHLEYNDSSMWDILFVINKMNSVFSLPQSADILYYKLEEKIALWQNTFKLSAEDLEIYKEAWYLELEIENEKHRKFRFVKKEYITQLITDLKAR